VTDSTAGRIFRGRMVMAPMTRGTDLPFRVLARELGAEVCFSEMAYAHKIVRGDRAENALLRRDPREGILGIQLAGKNPQVMAEAARIAADRGAEFVDVNLGCPIDDATRRGFGAALLRRAGRVASIIEAMKLAVTIPITIKLRSGWSSEKPTFLKIALAAEQAGVDAISLHARSRAQRYRRPADWQLVAELVGAVSVPVIGNGDIFGWRDARQRMEQTGCAGVMVGRWGLAKPWIFREFTENRSWSPDTAERLTVVRRYVELCREYFGDDEHGRSRTRRFLVFHQDFFRRYRGGAGPDAVNSTDPRDWGDAPVDDVGQWLCRSDVDGVEALCRWLVDGGPAQPPPPAGPESERAVHARAYG
jgi:tRNA-dihydrouridine synthase 3